MPQELHVLKCFKCETFQVHIIKKSKNWECKICGSNQSLKQEYGRGTGKECRLHVQKLNDLRYKKSLEVPDHQEVDNCNPEHQNVPTVIPESKWSKYLEKEDKLETSLDHHKSVFSDDGVKYLLEFPFRKRHKKQKESCKKNKNDNDAVDAERFCNDVFDSKMNTVLTKHSSPIEECIYGNTVDENLNSKNEDLAINPENNNVKRKIADISVPSTSKWAKYLVDSNISPTIANEIESDHSHRSKITSSQSNHKFNERQMDREKKTFHSFLDNVDEDLDSILDL